MPSNPRASLTLRIAQATGAVLAGLVLSSCGQPVHHSAGTAPIAPPAPLSNVADSAAPVDPPAPASTSAAFTPVSSSPKPSSTSAQTPRPERCHTSMLAGTVRHADQGAGQRYADLVLENRTGPTCTLYGYGGLELLDANGRPLPTNLSRTPNPGPQVLRLAKGQSARATLHWTAVPGEGEPTTGPCETAPAAARVTPPDEKDPLLVEWSLGSVCQHGSIDGSAYQR